MTKSLSDLKIPKVSSATTCTGTIRRGGGVLRSCPIKFGEHEVIPSSIFSDIFPHQTTKFVCLSEWGTMSKIHIANIHELSFCYIFEWELVIITYTRLKMIAGWTGGLRDRHGRTIIQLLLLLLYKRAIYMHGASDSLRIQPFTLCCVAKNNISLTSGHHLSPRQNLANYYLSKKCLTRASHASRAQLSFSAYHPLMRLHQEAIC